MQRKEPYADNSRTVAKLYFTSDYLAFFDEQNAINHAMRLCDKTITSMTREQVEAETAQVFKESPEDDLEDDDLLDLELI